METQPQSEHDQTQEVRIERITIRKRFIRPFSIWLSRKLDLAIKDINSGIAVLKNQHANPLFVDEIEGSIERVTQILKNLETAKKVVVKKTEGGWTLDFSEPNPSADEENSRIVNKASWQIMNPSLKFKFTTALSDQIGNNFSPVMGYSELMSMSEENRATREEAGKLYAASQRFNAIFEPIFTAHKIQLETDGAGNINVTPIRLQKVKVAKPKS